MRLLSQGAIAGVLMLAAPFSVHARMYQWVSPASATPQLSGEPPPWYRSIQGGPRVRVFDNGNLVDDTAIALPYAQREELRAVAFREAEERRRAEAVKRLELAARREERRQFEAEQLADAEREQAQAQPAPRRAEEAPTTPRSTASPPPAVEGPLDEDTVARLKAIIADFDRRGGAVAPQ